MERNIGRSGIGKIGNNPIHRFYHQMDVYGCLDTMAAQGLANHGAYRQIWNVMVVHNIKMHHVGPDAITASTSSPSFAKSAERIDGAIRSCFMVWIDVQSEP
jgi:hypothetical protein